MIPAGRCQCFHKSLSWDRFDGQRVLAVALERIRSLGWTGGGSRYGTGGLAGRILPYCCSSREGCLGIIVEDVGGEVGGVYMIEVELLRIFAEE